MQRIPTLIGAGLVAAATASAIAVGVGGAQAPAERTLAFVERTVPAADVFADVPPVSEKTLASAGDGYLFRPRPRCRQAPRSSASTRPAAAYLRATPRGMGSRLISDGVYKLRDGTIAGSDRRSPSRGTRRSTFVVTGGSGAYEGARGSGDAHVPARQDSPFADTTINLLP